MTISELQSLQHFLEHLGEDGMACAKNPGHKTHFHSTGIADQFEALRLIVARERLIVAREIASLTGAASTICPRCQGQGEHQECKDIFVTCSYCGGTGKLSKAEAAA